MAFDYSDFRITSFGADFIAGAIAKASGSGSDIYEITKMAIGQGHTTDPNPANLDDWLADIAIGVISIRNNKVSVRGIWSNAGQSNQLNISEMGVFGRISGRTAQLIAYCSTESGGEYIPPEAIAPIEKTYTCTLITGAAAEVTTNITSETPAPALGCARMDAYNDGTFEVDNVSIEAGDITLNNSGLDVYGSYVHEDESRFHAPAIFESSVSMDSVGRKTAGSGANTGISCADGMQGAGSFIHASGSFVSASTGVNPIAASSASLLWGSILSGTSIMVRYDNSRIKFGLILNSSGVVGVAYANANNQLCASTPLTAGATYYFVLF